MEKPKKEKTLVIIKPDALQRNLAGEILHRFERKGLKIIGLKMMHLNDVILTEHYVHHKEKPFFPGLRDFMKSAPVVVLALEGFGAVKAVRLLCGPTYGAEADAGSIRGDFSMSTQANIVHASDSQESAAAEIKRFFNDEEVFDYQKIDFEFIYGEEERS